MYKCIKDYCQERGKSLFFMVMKDRRRYQICMGMATTTVGILKH